MRIVIFGTGKIYTQFRSKVNRKDIIVAFLDNDKRKWGKELDGVYIYAPEDINQIDYDVIVLASQYAIQMKEQLIELGCSENEIIHCDEYKECNKDSKIYYPAIEMKLPEKRRCAIVCQSLGYHGGAIAALYCALALQECNINVDIIAEDGNSNMISDMNRKGISVIICPNISIEKWKSIEWIENYDYILVNTLPMILCALEISKHRSVYLWLHDSDNIYEYMNFWKDKIIQGLENKNLKICAVSNVAKQNFYKWITKCNIEVLPCGIADTDYSFSVNSKIVFAVIGSIHPIKGQDLLIQAVKRLPSYIYEQVEFWIIGKESDMDFYHKLQEDAKNIKCTKFMGEIEKEELKQMYSSIDIVIIPSRKETMSLVAIEAMSHGKLCIVSDAAGITDYLEDEKNSLIFSSENIGALADKIEWCLQNKNALIQLKKNAREIYEKYFSLKNFKKDLIKVLRIEE